jgi:hypothetical protein
MGIFVAQVVTEKPLIAFAREANDIERFGVKLKVARIELSESLDGCLFGDRETRSEPASR